MNDSKRPSKPSKPGTPSMPRIAFFGTPKFAADILRRIAGSVDVACAVTRPDAVRGRGAKATPSAVGTAARELGIPVYTPDNTMTALARHQVDFVVVAAYGLILPKAVLDAPKFCALNVHASLLPRWRGAAPMERAILAGDATSGVCIMQMEEKLDTGPVCARREFSIEDMYLAEMEDATARLGAEALLEALGQIMRGSVVWMPQPAEGATYAKKLARGELACSPAMTVEEISRAVRASSPAYPARATVDGRNVTIERVTTGEMTVQDVPEPQISGYGNRERSAAEESDEHADDSAGAPFAHEPGLASPAHGLGDTSTTHKPGDVVFAGKRLFIIAADGPVEILRLKPAGRNSMSGQAFAQGSPRIRQNSAIWSQ